MPLVKLIKIHNYYEYDMYGDELYKIICDSMSPWQEVTQEELQFLLNWSKKIPKYEGYKVVVFQDATSKEKVEEYIEDIKAFIKKEKLLEEQRELKEKKRIEKRKRSIEQRKIEKAKEVLKRSGINIQ